MLTHIEHRGVLISECSVSGETRADGTIPAHPTGIQVSQDRWLLLYSTRRFLGVDDERSIAYQLRAGSPAGRLLKEGLLAQSIDNWDALGDGRVSVKQHGHVSAFGVPKGALIGGKPAPHANLFVAKWRRVARLFDPVRNYVFHMREEPELRRRTLTVQWVHFRLSEAEDDIEIVEPISIMRQRGYEEGERFCSAEGVDAMNQAFIQAVPFNADCTEWAVVNHFDQRRVAPLKFRYNPQRDRYEWVETGPFMGGPDITLIEASLAWAGDSWIIAARTDHEEGERGAAFVRTEDPFTHMPPITFGTDPVSRGPLTLYRCPDGELRMFAGDMRSSPYGQARDPLYCWEVDPYDFTTSNRRVVFDTVRAGLPFRKESRPIADMCKLLPHQGCTQYLVHRVRVGAIAHPYAETVLNATEMAHSAIYHAELSYDQAYPETWRFESASGTRRAP